MLLFTKKRNIYYYVQENPSGHVMLVFSTSINTLSLSALYATEDVVSKAVRSMMSLSLKYKLPLLSNTSPAKYWSVFMKIIVIKSEDGYNLLLLDLIVKGYTEKYTSCQCKLKAKSRQKDQRGWLHLLMNSHHCKLSMRSKRHFSFDFKQPQIVFEIEIEISVGKYSWYLNQEYSTRCLQTGNVNIAAWNTIYT